MNIQLRYQEQLSNQGLRSITKQYQVSISRTSEYQGLNLITNEYQI